MIIYFVNKNSTIKGPFDIMDAHRNRIMKVGNVCIRETSQGVSFLLVVSETNRWNACKCIGYAKGDLGLEGNTLLFSFDGLSRRYGAINKIEALCTIFDEEPLHSFFTNAFEILSYNSDLWDVSTFSRMLSLSPLETPTMLREEPVTYNRGITKFERYLSKDSRTLFLSLHSQDKTLREAYQIVRENFPDDFRKAMKQFLRENPQATIYD